ncbi:MAG: septum formation initiator family protein [Hydrogenibacillus sp.]|nr:septum formation initiator family protein [Hydrogenibacillus sp.]
MAGERGSMRDGRRASGIRRRTAFVLFSACIVAAVMLFLRAEEKIRIVRAELESKQATLEKLKAENEALRRERERLLDPDYVTDIARTEWFWAKDGEILFKLTPEAPKKGD